MRITLEDIFSIPTAVIYNPDRYKSVTSVSIDTRTIKKNSIFVAINGGNFDGHNFVSDAIKKGAIAIVVSNRKLKKFDDVQVPIISVKNTLDTYAELAKIWRNKISAKVISITGSNGKTTTKEITAHLLSKKYKVHKTFANNNNQIGVPLTILSTPKNTDFIVLEHGTNHFGEIEFTARIAQPDFALITNIGNSHTKFLESKEKILEEKSKLLDHLRQGGFTFINCDDPLVNQLKKNAENYISYGFKRKCDVKAKRISSTIDSREKLFIEGFGKKIETTLPLLGESNSKNYLSAIAIALKCGISKTDVLKLTKSIKPVKGRLQKKDFRNFTIIDDTYNANPESVVSALKVLKEYKQRSKKIFVFGDMFELGNDSEDAHKKLSVEINKSKINSVYTIGDESKKIVDVLNKVKDRMHFNNRSALEKHLSKIEISDTVILIKGSRGMKMEDFVNVLERRAV
jgi:UDP-N-acetylmuramoyl-tripeptide--D-alanyl-D-alanine ligase